MPSKESLWPPAKKDISGVRLKKLLDDLKQQAAIFEHVLPAVEFDLSPLWENDAIRGQLLDMFLIKYREEEPAIAAAFSITGLNPKNAWHWAELFKAFCTAHFGNRGAGRNARQPDKLFELALRVAEIKKTKKIKDNGKIAKQLKKDFESDYGKQTADTLRKLIPKAEAFVKKAMTGRYPGNPIVNMLADDSAKDRKELTAHQVALANLVQRILENNGSGK
jgi:hypothetical protein